MVGKLVKNIQNHIFIYFHLRGSAIPLAMYPFSCIIVTTLSNTISESSPSNVIHQKENRQLKLKISSAFISMTYRQFRCKAHFCAATSRSMTGTEHAAQQTKKKMGSTGCSSKNTRSESITLFIIEKRRADSKQKQNERMIFRDDSTMREGCKFNYINLDLADISIMIQKTNKDFLMKTINLKFHFILNEVSICITFFIDYHTTASNNKI